MARLLDLIKQNQTLIGDGAMGTQLFERGVKTGECPEQVNMDRPEVLEEIARAYFAAGSDLVQTNTFGGSPLKLAQYRLDGQTEQINAAAVRAARRAAGSDGLVIASVGPSGKLLQPYGDTAPDEMRRSFERQLQALLAEGVDGLCVETMTDLAEAVLVIGAAKELSTDTPVMATMTFDATPNGFYTIMGVSIEQAVKGLASAGADLVGSNCGNGIENMIKIANEFRNQTDLPLVIQSNASLPEMKNGRAVYTESPEFMAQKCEALVARQVAVLGGCCGTTPGHIAALRLLVDNHAN